MCHYTHHILDINLVGRLSNVDSNSHAELLAMLTAYNFPHTQGPNHPIVTDQALSARSFPHWKLLNFPMQQVLQLHQRHLEPLLFAVAPRHVLGHEDMEAYNALHDPTINAFLPSQASLLAQLQRDVVPAFEYQGEFLHWMYKDWRSLRSLRNPKSGS